MFLPSLTGTRTSDKKISFSNLVTDGGMNRALSPSSSFFFYCRVCGMGRPFHSTRRVEMKWWSNFIEKIIALRKRERAKIRNAENKWLFLLDSRKWFPITANQYDSRSLTTEYHQTNWYHTQIREKHSFRWKKSESYGNPLALSAIEHRGN